MKYVWLLCRAYYPNIGGIETSIYEISKSLNKRGYKVIIVTEKLDIDNYKRREEFAHIEYYRLKANFLSRFFVPLRIRYRKREIIHILKEMQIKYGTPDFAISRDPLMGMLYFNNISDKITYIPPSVIAFDFENKNKKTLRHTIISRIMMRYEQYYQEFCFKRFKNIIVFSENVKRQILKRINNYHGKITVIYPGCSIDERFLNDYLYDNSYLRLLFVGRIVEDKNLLMLVQALEQINQSNIYLDIVGDGDQREFIEKYVIDNNIRNVIFHGFSLNTGIFYSKSDFTVVSSKYESFGQAITESLRYGTPVIGFKSIKGKTLTAVEELIENDITGLVMNDFTHDELKNTIKKAIHIKTDREQYFAMRNKCMVYADHSFNWNDFTKHCIETLLYER